MINWKRGPLIPNRYGKNKKIENERYVGNNNCLRAPSRLFNKGINQDIHIERYVCRTK